MKNLWKDAMLKEVHERNKIYNVTILIFWG